MRAAVTGGNLYAAIDSAAHRAGRTLTRTLQRERTTTLELLVARARAQARGRIAKASLPPSPRGRERPLFSAARRGAGPSVDRGECASRSAPLLDSPARPSGSLW